MINSYYVMINGEEVGPHTQYEVMDMNLDARTMVLSPLANGWQEIIDLPEFTRYLETQGIYFPTKANLASFWWRLLAYLIDYVIIIIIGVIIVSGLTIVKGLTGRLVGEDPPDDSYYNLLLLIIMILYHSILEATNLRGGIGKTVCKLCVVNAKGGRISLLNALGRNFAKLFSYILLGLGFLNILWDDRRQGWHDGIAKTFVIRR